MLQPQNIHKAWAMIEVRDFPPSWKEGSKEGRKAAFYICRRRSIEDDGTCTRYERTIRTARRSNARRTGSWLVCIPSILKSVLLISPCNCPWPRIEASLVLTGNWFFARKLSSVFASFSWSFRTFVFSALVLIFPPLCGCEWSSCFCFSQLPSYLGNFTWWRSSSNANANTHHPDKGWFRSKPVVKSAPFSAHLGPLPNWGRDSLRRKISEDMCTHKRWVEGEYYLYRLNCGELRKAYRWHCEAEPLMWWSLPLVVSSALWTRSRLTYTHSFSWATLASSSWPRSRWESPVSRLDNDGWNFALALFSRRELEMWLCYPRFMRGVSRENFGSKNISVWDIALPGSTFSTEWIPFFHPQINNS